MKGVKTQLAETADGVNLRKPSDEKKKERQRNLRSDSLLAEKELLTFPTS